MPIFQREYREQMPPPIDFNTRCLQIWQVLIASASNRQTITYGQIKSALNWGVPPYGYGRHLDSILAFCRSRQRSGLCHGLFCAGAANPRGIR